MAIQVVTEFTAKTTVRIIAYVYNDAGELTDPSTSIKVTIYDPNGTKQVNGEDMTPVSTEEKGVYEYFYPTTVSTAKGWWRGEIEVIDGTGEAARTSMGDFSFRIK